MPPDEYSYKTIPPEEPKDLTTPRTPRHVVKEKKKKPGSSRPSSRVTEEVSCVSCVVNFKITVKPDLSRDHSRDLKIVVS